MSKTKNSIKERAKAVPRQIKNYVEMNMLLIELENWFNNHYPHSEEHTKIYDLLNKIENNDE